LIAAAACARALLETAAAFWCDARELAVIWSRVKQTATPNSALANYRDLAAWLWSTQYAGKFDKGLADLAKTWVVRTNVIGQVDKLSKAIPHRQVQDSYQYLCNTVHPSIGATFAMSSTMLTHRTGTHAYIWYAPKPIRHDDGGVEIAETMIPEAIVRSAVTAVRVLAKTLDESLRVVDDIALTTRAPRMAAFSYWRNVDVTTPKQLCPCRSGQLARKCPHHWGDPAPTICEKFDQA
jgi:hypothetical protein